MLVGGVVHPGFTPAPQSGVGGSMSSKKKKKTGELFTYFRVDCLFHRLKGKKISQAITTQVPPIKIEIMPQCCQSPGTT